MLQSNDDSLIFNSNYNSYIKSPSLLNVFYFIYSLYTIHLIVK